MSEGVDEYEERVHPRLQYAGSKMIMKSKFPDTRTQGMLGISLAAFRCKDCGMRLRQSPAHKFTVAGIKFANMKKRSANVEKRNANPFKKV